MCLLANTPFRLLQFEAISTRNGVAYPKKQSKYDSLLGVFVAVGIQASANVDISFPETSTKWADPVSSIAKTRIPIF
jgi:hypothetical protein